jgi:uncharacterized protein (TIGR00369 family)
MSETSAQDFNGLLGLRLVGPAPEGFVVELEAMARHLHGRGMVHGGVYLALLDTAMARAARDGLDPAVLTPTIELKAAFLRAAGPGLLRARGWVVRRARRAIFTEGDVTDADGRVLSKGSATFLR